jgi:hypothetical protein
MYPMLDIEGSAAHAASETAETLARWSPLRRLAQPGRKPPLYLARAGADAIPDLLPGLDRFVAEALARDYPLTLANNPGAEHGFDIGDPAPRTLEIIEGMLDFLRRHLETRGSPVARSGALSAARTPPRSRPSRGSSPSRRR